MAPGAGRTTQAAPLRPHHSSAPHAISLLHQYIHSATSNRHMQHARMPPVARDPAPTQPADLSQYLRQEASGPAELHRNNIARSASAAGSMSQVATTLIVGKPRSAALPSTNRSRNHSEPVNHKGSRLDHSRSVGDAHSGLISAPHTADTYQSGRPPKPASTVPEDPVQMTVWFHELAAYSEDVVVDTSALAGSSVGNVYELQPVQKAGEQRTPTRLVFILSEKNLLPSAPPVPHASVPPKAKPSFQISLTSALQKPLDIPPRSAVQVRLVTDRSTVELDTVEIYIKDVHFSRDSQWSLASSMVGTCCYMDQKVIFLSNRIGSIRSLFKNGKKTFSGYISSNTSIIFRSESARLVFLVQLSREMWHFEENGEIMFHKLVNTLFPMIFKKWRSSNAHHAITIVLFTTVDFTRAPWMSLGGGERPAQCQDYYRVVVDQVSVFIWDKIMANLRLEFATFKRDILLHLEGDKFAIKGEPCPSVKGNLLEAINLSLNLVSDRYKNTDLRHSINHLVVVTPGAGLFDVDYDLMLQTSKKMFSLDCALDIVCLSQPPLHIVPLFRYRSDKGDVCHCVPKWCDMSFYGAATGMGSQWIPRCKIYELQMMGLMENEVSDVQLDRIKFKHNVPIIESMDIHDERIFSPVNEKPLITRHRFEKRRNKFSASNNAATLSLMRKGEPDLQSTSRATTNVSTTNSTINGLVTNSSMTNSALSSLYTLNKTGEDPGVKASRPASLFLPQMLSKKNVSSTSLNSNTNQSLKSLLTTSEPASKTETSKTRFKLSTRKHEHEDHESVEEKLQSAKELERSEREENNPYWMPVNNPSEPQKVVAADLSRWADVFPPNVRRKMFKWRSLKAPAALPIGTTLFPTISQVETEYTFQTYAVTLNYENRLELRTSKDLMREMIRLRLAMGFQICYGPNVRKIEAERKSGGYPDGLIKYLPVGDCTGSRIYLSLNEEIHRLVYDINGSLNVQLYKRVPDDKENKILLGSQRPRKQKMPLIRTRYADEYTPSKVKSSELTLRQFNWNQMDQLIAGYDDAVPEENREFFKMKFVVIPGEMPNNAYHINNEKLTEEEIRLEGLRKLIGLIERGRYKEKEELVSKQKEEIIQEISFYTGNLHDFLNEQAEFFDLSGTKPENSLMVTDGSRFNMNIRLSQLAQELQAEAGLNLVDRTWHFKLHPHCFLGSDLVSWLIKSFEDIDSREAATEYGQILMDNNLFRHVENRHGFLDGHYFYEFSEEYADSTSKTNNGKKGWFRIKSTQENEDQRETKDIKLSKEIQEQKDSKDSKDPKEPRESKTPTSAPNTPLSIAPSMAPNTPSHTRNNSDDTASDLRKVISQHLLQESESSSLNNSQKARRKKKFLISKHVKYDCDPTHKSFRSELVDVHYDTVHNPEHCYHIRLQWLNTTTKFIDETIISWSRFCERYALKLVETPWTELCTVPESNPFHSFVDVKLAVNPLTDSEFKDCEILKTNKFYFHLHLLKVADFYLDNRGSSFFRRENIEICYSWGKSTFKYAQFIHKTGSYIVELRENGEFCMSPNNVHILRVNTFVSPISESKGKIDSQKVMLMFRESCGDEQFLRQVFRDAYKFLQEDYDAAYVVGM